MRAYTKKKQKKKTQTHQSQIKWKHKITNTNSFRYSFGYRWIICVITLTSYGLCWATICLHLHSHAGTHARTRTLLFAVLHLFLHTSTVYPWRHLTGPRFLQTQQVTYRTTVCSVQDLSRWQSSKTGRGPLEKGWRDDHTPIMCSYKRVQCSFEVYGFQTRTEEFIHRVRQLFFPPHEAFSLWNLICS